MGNNFMKCGMAGWCLEVLWTGIHGGVKNKKRSYLWQGRKSRQDFRH